MLWEAWDVHGLWQALLVRFTNHCLVKSLKNPFPTPQCEIQLSIRSLILWSPEPLKLSILNYPRNITFYPEGMFRGKLWTSSLPHINFSGFCWVVEFNWVTLDLGIWNNYNWGEFDSLPSTSAGCSRDIELMDTHSGQSACDWLPNETSWAWILIKIILIDGLSVIWTPNWLH